ncbi:MAG: hypothetical protein KKD44_01910, partial [Proteobacteria bacterium]|nr:hypothetical protein [Pseudomonadota bacterium]
MKALRVWLAFLSVFLLVAGCSRGGGSSNLAANITVSGSVNDQDIASASVAMKHGIDDDILSTATCDEHGNFSLSVERAKLLSSDAYVLTATHPLSGRVLRSWISGADILASGNSFSSDLTVISPYTEAACLVANIKDSTASPLSFLKKSIRLTGSGLPRSTGNAMVDAIGVWIKAKF